METVYASVGGKRELLKVALDIAVVGDDRPIPFLARPELLAVGEGSLRERASDQGLFILDGLEGEDRHAITELVPPIPRWSATNTIVTADPPREIAWIPHYAPARDRTEWRYVLEPTPGGTRITQIYRVISLPWWFDRAVWVLTPAHHDRREALRGDLLRLGDLAAGTGRTPRTADIVSTDGSGEHDRFAGRAVGNGRVEQGGRR